MKRSWAVAAVLVVGLFAVSGCNDYGSTFQNNTGAVITSLSPSNINAGGSNPLTLVVNGSGFVAQTKVSWNGSKLATTVTLDSTGTTVLQVSAVVPPSLFASAGTATVITANPFSGSGNNGLSNPLTFTINPPGNPVPAISAISPNTAAAGSAAVTLTITGSTTPPANFLLTTDPSGGTQVLFNLPTSQTTLANPTITATQITVQIPASLLATAASASVTVFNPPTASGGGGPSNSEPFTITGPGGTAPPGSALEETPAVSVDGRYVAYTSTQDGHSQTFLRDTCQTADSSCVSRTLLVSSGPDGSAGNNDSHWPSMSSDGRYVAFTSAASNLVAGAATGRQIYLRDTCLGAASSCVPTTQLVSTDPSGALVGTEAILPSVSASGRFVAFISVTPTHDANQAGSAKVTSVAANSGYRQVFVRDTCLGAASCTPKTTRISLDPGDSAAAGSVPARPALSGGAKNIALAGAGNSTWFTHTVPVDDSVFLAVTNAQP